MRIQALICAIFIFLGCKPAEMPKDVGSLSGSVFYKNRFGTMPDAGAKITLYRDTDSGAYKLQSLHTDVSGRFEIDSLETGKYIILVNSNSEYLYPFSNQLTDLMLSAAMLNRIYTNMPYQSVFDKRREVDSVEMILISDLSDNFAWKRKTRDSLEKEMQLFVESILPEEIEKSLGLGWGRFSKRFQFRFLNIEKDKKVIENIEIR